MLFGCFSSLLSAVCQSSLPPYISDDSGATTQHRDGSGEGKQQRGGAAAQGAPRTSGAAGGVHAAHGGHIPRHRALLRGSRRLCSILRFKLGKMNSLGFVPLIHNTQSDATMVRKSGTLSSHKLG